jgi:hypothetical protein
VKREICFSRNAKEKSNSAAGSKCGRNSHGNSGSFSAASSVIVASGGQGFSHAVSAVTPKWQSVQHREIVELDWRVIRHFVQNVFIFGAKTCRTFARL